MPDETLPALYERNILADLLPVLDTFAHAISAARRRQDHAAILEGVEMVEREMRRILGTYGLERIEVAPGQPFDWLLHETLEGLDGIVQDAVIAEELRPGYRQGGRVLRRAIVKLK